jgi:tRNA A37 threonylcarbamoyladenosine dehydratase
MSNVNRTLLAFAAILPLAVVVVVIGNALGLGSWGFTALALVAVVLVSLVDREGFYGTTRRRHAPPS